MAGQPKINDIFKPHKDRNMAKREVVVKTNKKPEKNVGKRGKDPARWSKEH